MKHNHRLHFVYVAWWNRQDDLEKIMNETALHKKLNALSKLTRHWPGEPLDDRGVIRVLNPAGKRAPIVWVFNAAHEPRQFSRALGPDQPLVVLRSLNQIQRASPSRYDTAEHLAEYYARQLASTLPNKVSLVGGNCQGAPIALWIANRLLDRGHDVGCAATVDARPWVEIQLPILLSFGIDWKEDDFFAGVSSDPFEVNNRFYADWRHGRLRCTHGHYFDPEHVDHLADNLRRFMRQEGCWQETLQSRLARTLRTKAKGVFRRAGAFRVRDKILALSKSRLPD